MNSGRQRPKGLVHPDETVYRRIVWQGGGGYLAVHDLPGSRWAFFGPWELTLGPKVRYNRWIEKSPGNRLRKGKLLIGERKPAPQTHRHLALRGRAAGEP